jgi:hypothetical protein
LWGLIGTTAALSQDITLPTKVQGEPGVFLVVTAQTKGASVCWYCVTPGLSMIPPQLLKDSKSAVVLAAKPGKYTIIAWTAVNNQPTDAATCVLVVGSPPDPGPTPPGPGPGPSPGPTPPSELVQALNSALVKDGKNAAALELCKKIAAVARILADKGKSDASLKTAGDVYTLWNKSIKNVVQPSDILQTRLAIGAYLNSKLPTALDAALDAPTRQQMFEEFSKIAAALEGLQ